MSTYTSMEFTVRKEGQAPSFKVMSNSQDGRVVLIQGDNSIGMGAQEAEQLVRILQHCLARARETKENGA